MPVPTVPTGYSVRYRIRRWSIGWVLIRMAPDGGTHFQRFGQGRFEDVLEGGLLTEWEMWPMVDSLCTARGSAGYSGLERDARYTLRPER
jgi:hypothetical protein